MKKIFKKQKQVSKQITKLLPILGIIAMSSCTKNFEKYNTDSRGITEAELQGDFNFIASYFPQIQKNIYSTDVGNYQLQQSLIGDVFSQYMIPPTPFRGNINNITYALVDGWNGTPFQLAYTNVMAPALEIEKKGKVKAPDFFAVAQILKVAAMHRVTDIYGPIPYSQYGKSATTPYDAQEVVYNTFFTELDEAITTLDNKIKTNPGMKPFAGTDLIYGGDYTKWIRLANSLRLRLALRIVYANASKAQAEGEKALSNSYGLLNGNADNAMIQGKGILNPLSTITNSWDDTRMSAPMESFLGGYHDPRMAVYFQPSTQFPGTFRGIRQGIKIDAKATYVNFSKLGTYFTDATPIQLMTCAEVYFLRAEAALRNWANAGGTVQDLYEKGISNSFTQWGVAGGIASYLNDNTSQPKPYVDPLNSVNNVDAGSPNLSVITIKWDEATTFETKLERIITQKWIAVFPDGQEGWSEFRRTGYPKLYPVIVNNSNGAITGFVKRINFTQDEYLTNRTEIQKAILLLGGGSDNGGTRLWWDKK